MNLCTSCNNTRMHPQICKMECAIGREKDCDGLCDEYEHYHKRAPKGWIPISVATPETVGIGNRMVKVALDDGTELKDFMLNGKLVFCCEKTMPHVKAWKLDDRGYAMDKLMQEAGWE